LLSNGNFTVTLDSKYLSKAKIVNLRDYPLQIRLFFTHDFHINGYEAGDNALFNTQQLPTIYYKGKWYFLVCGDSGEEGVNQHASAKHHESTAPNASKGGNNKC
jgi:hypothetical protein